jgi:hypothetical protein
LVKWKGYNECSWEPAINVDGLKAIHDVHKEQPGKPRSITSYVFGLEEGELLLQLCQVRIENRVWFDEEDIRMLMEPGFMGTDQDSLQGIRFYGKESGFIARNQGLWERIRFR